MHAKARIHADPALEFDQFDCLLDSLVILILNKLDDVRSLCRCSAASRRFNVLAPLVHDVCVMIDRVVAVDGDLDDPLNLMSPKPQNIISHFLKLMLFAITKPFHDMRNPNGTRRPLFPQLPHHSPVQVLRNFSHVRNLRVELPRGHIVHGDRAAERVQGKPIVSLSLFQPDTGPGVQHEAEVCSVP